MFRRRRNGRTFSVSTRIHATFRGETPPTGTSNTRTSVTVTRRVGHQNATRQVQRSNSPPLTTTVNHAW